MMQRYCSSQGQCYSCGMMFHHQNQICACGNGGVLDQSALVVDCTLSLGTPSTRLCEEEDEKRRRSVASSSPSCMSNFWDLIHTKSNNAKTAPYAGSYHSNYQKTIARGNNGNDPLLARRCANCDTTSTPLWRNGPRGPKSLCNACGIRFKKEEKRTTAANGGASVVAGVAEQNQHQHQHHYHHANNYINYQSAAGSWVNNHAPTQRVARHAPNELCFVDDVGGGDLDSDSAAVPFLSWRLNVADRASLVHDFIR